MNTNAIAFIGLCNEYCTALETAAETERGAFVDKMLRLLPRLYIAATDLKTEEPEFGEAYLESSLDEDYYDSIRRSIETVMGEDDTYLEVFEEDMKYSDTPLAASVSEGLADIFQAMYNFIESVKDSTDATVELALAAMRDDFRSFWSAPLCNVLRALNHIKMNQ